MRNIRNDKGITLVTLMITIIVLLILSVITISGIRNGALTRVKESSANLEVAMLQKSLDLAKTELQFNGKILDEDQTLQDYIDLINETKEYKVTSIIQIDDNLEILINGKYKFLIEYDDGDIITDYEGELEEGENFEGKQNLNLQLSEKSGTYTFPEGGTFTVTNNLGNGTITASSSNTSIATATVSGNTITVEPATTAGEAIITVRCAETENYISGIATFKVTMQKANNTLTLSETSGNTTYGTNKTFTVTTNTSGGTLSVTSSNTNVATASISGNIVTMVPVVDANGIATITVTSTATGKYNAATVRYTLTVKKRPPQVTSLMRTVATKNETVCDINGNDIVVPEGFKVVANGTSNVEYNYDSTNHTPCVQDGIVIENATDGNQFVWVPIGEINNKDSSKTTITLGRYTFASNGTETLVQNATNYTEETAISTYLKELATSSYGNATALDLEEWITTAQANGGYYIGRYEASKNGTKAASKPSTGTPLTSSGTPSDGMLWNNITQLDAAEASQAMYPYSSNAKVYSDLINSYAWDTAIVFIQEYSGYIRETTKYSKENGQTFSTSLQNTGTNGDKVCNIYDMASNTREWTTESYANSNSTCTYRGGYYGGNSTFTSGRYYYYTSYSNISISFRSTLYVK